jgi:hypothetical protein
VTPNARAHRRRASLRARKPERAARRRPSAARCWATCSYVDFSAPSRSMLRLDKKHGSSPQRCGQPGQQHGLRVPPRILSRPTSMRRFLVSSFLADVTQQIHSFRASGVRAAQRLFTAASDSMALRKSDGSLWIAPPATALVVMRQLRRASCRRTPALTGRRGAKRRGNRKRYACSGPVERVVRRRHFRRPRGPQTSGRCASRCGRAFEDRFPREHGTRRRSLANLGEKECGVNRIGV